MSTPRVVRRGHPGALYVGRPTKWGNPFRLQAGASLEQRREAIGRYRSWLVLQPALLAALPELRGRDLACYCAPLQCHADVLLELANMTNRIEEPIRDGFAEVTVGMTFASLTEEVAAPGAVPSVRIIRCHCPPGSRGYCECDPAR